MQRQVFFCSRVLMKHFFLLLLVSFPAILHAQKGKWELSLQIQPEATFHKESYMLFDQQNAKTTMNIGFASLLQYNLNKRFFVNAGAGFISRKLNTENFLNQAALPPPRQSHSQEFVTSQYVSYRTIFLPVNIGYKVILKKKLAGFITSGFAANYLLNTYYNANFTKYQGTYKKNYWQGYTINVGAGADYKLLKNIFLTTSVSYAPVNTVHADQFLPDREGNGLKLTHNFLSLSVGVKMPF